MKEYIKALGSIILLCCITFGICEASKHFSKPQPKAAQVEVSEMTKSDSIYNAIIDMRIQYPHIVMAQAILESNNFTSSLMKSNNNIFGMKFPGQRPTTAIGVCKGYAKYISIFSSIEDYALFQEKFMQVNSEEQYYSKLAKSYASDKKYIHKLKVIVNQLLKNGNYGGK